MHEFSNKIQKQKARSGRIGDLFRIIGTERRRGGHRPHSPQFQLRFTDAQVCGPGIGDVDVDGPSRPSASAGVCCGSAGRGNNNRALEGLGCLCCAAVEL